MVTHRSDFLVIGSGVAGLKTALEAAKYGTVHLVTKKEHFESNTNYAQGGIASVLDKSDSFDAHVNDTLVAGAGLCHRKTVEYIVSEGPTAIRELINVGVEFTRDPQGNLELGREGGHSARRIVHAKDLTGREVEKALLNKVHENPNIRIFQHHFAVDLILDQNQRCWGAWVWDKASHDVHNFVSSVTNLCTGGCGLVYYYSTNPPIATGDGVAMAFRAGCQAVNMEFMQFHPTAFYMPDSDRPFLISEAVRGEGGILRARDGTAFMENYHEMKDLAPRDIVARAIDTEMKERGDDFCYLDVHHLGIEFLKERFPNITAFCQDRGLDLSKDMIPIVPAAHYMCGGVKSSLFGGTSITGLFATGEVGCTGVHGANRLASNSILEAFVISHRSMQHAYQEGLYKQKPPENVEAWDKSAHQEKLESVRLVNLRRTLRMLMWDYVGIVRSNKRLSQAQRRLSVLKEEIDACYQTGRINNSILELRNIAHVAELIVLSALQRKESRGLHFNTDYPHQEQIAKDTIIYKDKEDQYKTESIPIPN